MEYPYYIVPAVEEYRRLEPGSEEAKKIARFLGANIGDYASLRLILGIDPPEFARFYPDMETSTPTTLDTIDSFLDKFGGNIQDDLYLDSRVSGYVLEEETTQGATGEDEKSSYNHNEPSLPQLIKAKQYSEAIELIEKQNLNNPEKSIYFAHQIRFLKKLKAISTYKTKNQS